MNSKTQGPTVIAFLSRRISRTLLPVLFISTVISHTLTILLPDYHSLLSNALSKIAPSIRAPYSEIADLKHKNAALKENNDALRKKYSNQIEKNKASKKVSQKIAKRLIRNVSVNTGSVLVESIPYLGVGTLIGVTAMDVNDACETMKDVNTMLSNIGEEPDEHTATQVCSYTDKIPSPKEIAEYLDQSTDDLISASENKMAEVKNYMGNLKSGVGSFFENLKQSSRENWGNFMNYLNYD